MRRTIGVSIHSTSISNATRRALVPFSTSSNFGGGGGGRGRGGPPSGPGPFNFNERAPGKPSSGESKSDTTESSIPPGSGHGDGRGKPILPPSGFPSFSSFMSSIKQPPAGRGRGTGAVAASQPEHQQPPDSGPKMPNFVKSEDDASPTARDDFKPLEKPVFPVREDVVSPTPKSSDHENDKKLDGSILGVLSGFGRGKPIEQADPQTPVAEENRHRRPTQRVPGAGPSEPAPERRPKLSREDAVNNARKFLSKGEVGGSDTGRERGPEERSGMGRGRGGRGRGRGRGRGAFRVRDGEERGGRSQDAKASYAGLYLGDDADGEKLAKRYGPEIMNQLTEGFEEMASQVLPSPLEDEYVEALDINYSIECEPEYMMGEFDLNPDIDEKEPIPLREFLEKVKPFLMAYEGIQSQEEWEEVMEETMARVPLLKKIVDHYCGPDRVTAKKQQGELERVAKTLPQSAPSSVKQFTDRAVISLQSNPGWGFDKKCHFMDKLVQEVSQHYK